ncbi:type III toxin-antitoxin system ToxN/AbiQ family toxin [Raoultibacter phocaeensis]|uniref:type III toxin-antitoxin system ToxN/AbiQ family toxin n=1 Tax=Raoultibacter phocaeensis TaxID=2479841 RepID=UPI0034E2D047
MGSRYGTVKDFNLEDYKRKRLLLEELVYCNRKAKRIISKAQHVYHRATSGEDPHMSAVCCDFKRLERYVGERESGD